MKGRDLKNFIESIEALKLFFKGVFSINQMPKTLKKREFYFTNLDLTNGEGSHWICVLKNDKKDLEIFDSLGLNETKLEWFLKYLKIKNISTLHYNITPVQSFFTNTCGKFVLYFAIKRLFNIDESFNSLLNDIFELNQDENEIIVNAFLICFQQ